MNNQWMKLSALGILMAGCTGQAVAQDETDALRYSLLQPQGTARSIGFGSALGSVGGDFTSLSVNPAGLGIYRKSEFVITPSLMFNNVKGDYLGTTQTESGAHFSVSSIGFVFSKAERGRRYERSNWKSVSFGIGLNRLADFKHNYSYQGKNPTSSASWVFEADANANARNYQDDSRPAFLGFQSYLLDSTVSNGQPNFFSVVNPTPLNPVNQLVSVNERGGLQEFVLSLGGNYKEKLMVGGTLGFPIIRFLRDKSVIERDLSGDPNNNFDNFIYSQDLTTNGEGINFKLGFIYKPNDYFRLGAAIHTPTYMTLSDVSHASVTANTENFGGVQTVPNSELRYDYSLTTPWRAVLSGTAMLGSYGFFTVDYEYIDYSTSKFHFDNADNEYQQQINNIIRSSYRGAQNVRTGVEIKLDNFALRGGFGYYGSPYKSSVYSDGQRLDFSAGLGFRMPHAFIDLGFVHHQYKNSEQPYVLPYTNITVPSATLTTGQNNFAATLGFKF